MLQRELLIVMACVAALFLGIAGTGWFAVRRLNQTSRQLVLDTLPWLVEAGTAEERMHQERRLMREMLFPHTPAERSAIMSSVATNRTDLQWQLYAASIFEPEDQTNYQSMMLVRSNYLQTFPAFFELVGAGKIDQADAFFYGRQSDLFKKYLAAADTVFAYNVRQGQERGQAILNATRYAPLVIGALCVLVFVLGLFLGLRLALHGRV